MADEFVVVNGHGRPVTHLLSEQEAQECSKDAGDRILECVDPAELERLRKDADTLRAELSRLSAVEAELAGIKERINAAPELCVGDPAWHDGTLEYMDGQRVRLIAN